MSAAVPSRLGHPTPRAALNNLGDLEFRHGNIEAARSYFLESARNLDMRANSQPAGITMCNLANVELRLGMLDEAKGHCAAAIRAWQDCGAHIEIPGGIEQMAEIAVKHEKSERAARLHGAAAALRDQYGVRGRSAEELASTVDAAERILGAEVYYREIDCGRQMKLEDAIAYALSQ